MSYVLPDPTLPTSIAAPGLDVDGTASTTIKTDVTTIESKEVNIADNLLALNTKETGAGITAVPPYAGLQIMRGTSATKYLMYDETDATFKMGALINLKTIAGVNLTSGTGVLGWDGTEFSKAAAQAAVAEFAGLLLTGNDVKVNGVQYYFPTMQGGVGTALINDGSGTLSWSASGSTLSQGLAHYAAGQPGNTKDIGLVGEYNNATSVRYAGIMRHAADSTFYIFDGASSNPFVSDVVNPAGPGFTLAPMKAASLSVTSGIILTGGSLAVQSGDLSASGILTAGNLRINGNDFISIDTDGDINLIPDGAGNVILKADPTQALGAATKQYVDAVATGLDPKASVRVITVASLISAPYNAVAAGAKVGKTLTRGANGAIAGDAAAFDGQVLALNDRVLVTMDGVSNGIYAVTNVGSGASPWILTRATDADQNAEVSAGMFTFSQTGTQYANTGWVLATPDPIDVDVTSLDFVQFSAAGVISLANIGTGANVVAGLVGTTYNLRSFIATVGVNSTNALQTIQNTNDITYRFDQSKVTGTGALAAGSIVNGFGAITTANAMTTSDTVTGGTLSTTGSLWTATGSVQTYAGVSSGSNFLTVPSNQADALSLRDGAANTYLRVDSTTGAVRTVIPQGVLAFSTVSGASQIRLTDSVADGLRIRNAAGTIDLMHFSTQSTGRVNINAATSLNANTFAFANPVASFVELTTNLANALKIRENGNDMLTFQTTTASRKIIAGTEIRTDDGRLTFNAANNFLTIPYDNPASLIVRDSSGNLVMSFDTTNGAAVISHYPNSIFSGDVTLNGAETYIGTGYRDKVTSLASNTTLDNTYNVVRIDCTSGNLTMTLPAANDGQRIRFVKTDTTANTATIQPASGEPLEGIVNDTIVLRNKGDRTALQSIGVGGWYII